MTDRPGGEEDLLRAVQALRAEAAAMRLRLDRLEAWVEVRPAPDHAPTLAPEASARHPAVTDGILAPYAPRGVRKASLILLVVVFAVAMLLLPFLLGPPLAPLSPAP